MISSGYPVFNGNGEIIGAIDIFRRIERSRKLANVIAGYNASYSLRYKSKIKETIDGVVFSHSEEYFINGESGDSARSHLHNLHTSVIAK